MHYLDVVSGSIAHDILLSELHGGDFGAFTQVNLTTPLDGPIVRAAISECLTSWPSLGSRVIRNGSNFRIADRADLRVEEFEDGQPLTSRTFIASRGSDLFRFHLLGGGLGVQFLFHHLVVDADSIFSFIEDFDLALSGSSPLGSGWYWDDCITSDPLMAWPAVEHIPHQGIVRKKSPSPNAFASFDIAAELELRIRSTARAEGLSAFALFWAAAVATVPRAGGLSTVVSRRMEQSAPNLRGGNFSDVVGVELADMEFASTGVDFIKDAYERFIAAWSAPDAKRKRVADRSVMFSLSSIGDASALEHVSSVVLGPYVAKYSTHMQIHATKSGFSLEIYAVSGAQALLRRYLIALRDILGELGLDSGISVPILPIEFETKVLVSAASERAAATLAAILDSRDDFPLDELAIDSISALNLCSAIDLKFNSSPTMEDFYSWVVASDVRRFIEHTATSVASKSHELASETSDELHPHLNAIFIDSFRSADPRTYEVELAFEVHGADSCEQLKEAVDNVFANNDIFSQHLTFENGVVVARFGTQQRVCEVMEISQIDDIRDPIVLSVRKPQNLLVSRVAPWRSGYLLYLKAHHLLMDNIGVERFIEQVALGVKGEPLEPLQYADVSNAYREARTSALQLWAKTPLNDRHTGVGKQTVPSGNFEELFLRCVAPVGGSHDDVVHRVCVILGEFFDVSRGAIGAVYHGRAVPQSHLVIGSFARVLPIYFDAEDHATLERSLRRARAGQACNLHDLEFLGFGTLPVVFQMVRDSADHGDFTGPRHEFVGLTKFGMFIELLLGRENPDGSLRVALDSSVYTADETADLFERFSACFAQSTVRSA